MDAFKFNGQATIKHINPRKEGPEDDKNLAVDIKLNGTVDWAAWDFFHEDLRPVLYTDVGAAKNCMMESIGFSHSVRNCTLTILERTFHGVEVKNFKLRPTDGFKADLTFSATITPDGDDIGLLAEYLQEEVAVIVEPQPELFDAEQPAKGTEIRITAETAFGDSDPMYQQAVELVISNQRASVSSVQRHLKIGYNRAARLLEQMEQAGAVSAMQPNGHREVLLSTSEATA